MKRKGIRLFFLLFAVGNISTAQPTENSFKTAKPWTYWWWMSSAVDSSNISHQLSLFSKSGLGGVHIIPIYGAKGYEDRFIPFLSRQWLNMVSYTVKEARRLGLGVDLSLGSGWPYGGPFVSSGDVARRFAWVGDSMIIKPTGQQVKRAAWGGEGPVLDYFDAAALQHYLKHFEALDSISLRAAYHDSYEVYKANWTSHFLQKFRQLRGYDLQPYLAKLKSNANDDSALRILYDYRETMSDLLTDSFTAVLSGWSRQHKLLLRDQAHGSPANIIDLYAMADIPETESFGSSKFPIPLLRFDSDYVAANFGRPDPLILKMASSSANLAGRKLVSSETATWLANHFKVSLAQVKPQVDLLFTAGINHIFYHGIAYSPTEAPFPGWLFYAATNFGPGSSIWPDLPELNHYIQNCQQRLQNSTADPDVLLYFPISDIWSQPSDPEDPSWPLQLMDVHHADSWLLNAPVGQLARQLLNEGYQFDYVSDRWLQKLHVNGDGSLRVGQQSYKALLFPSLTHLPMATARKLDSLIRQGAHIKFAGTLPHSSTGLKDWPQRQEELKKMVDRWAALPGLQLPEHAPLQSGLAVEPELLPSIGLSFIRKKMGADDLYFITNLGNQFQEGSIRLARSGRTAICYDPLTGQSGRLTIQQINRQTQCVISLPPGRSLFIRLSERSIPAKLFLFYRIAGPALPLHLHWTIQFPGLRSLETDSLQSWTMLGDSSHAYFSGKAVYTTHFSMKGKINPEGYWLQLGDVRETAEIRLNGHLLGKRCFLPYTIYLPATLLKKQNQLEIGVRNLAANAIIQLDRKGVDWKHFYDINFVDITYKPFNAANWLIQFSGLLGPVRLLPASLLH